MPGFPVHDGAMRALRLENDQQAARCLARLMLWGHLNAGQHHRARLDQESPHLVFNHVLIVCVGNICRSPIAEYLLRDALGSRDVQCTSAGIGALVDRPIDATAGTLLSEHGLDGSAHRARQLTAAMLRESDLVLTMEKQHVNAIGKLAPEASGKVLLLDKWLQGRDISDPFRRSRGAFEQAFGLIEQGVRSWLPYL